MSTKITITSTKVNSNTDNLKAQEKAERAEARRLVSMANKRLRRLEQQNLQDTPAYQSWYNNGAVKFSVKGKTHKEVKHEMARINKFLNFTTSTVTGAKKNLKDIANRVHLTTWDNFDDLQRRVSDYYDISNRILELAKTTRNWAQTFNYEKVGEIVAEYMEEVNGQVTKSDEEILMLANRVAKAVGNQAMSKELDSLADDMNKMLGF